MIISSPSARGLRWPGCHGACAAMNGISDARSPARLVRPLRLRFPSGFLSPQAVSSMRAEAPPASLSPVGGQLFDSGLGRSLWWVKCGDPRRIASAIRRFPEARRAELWAGVGIAAAYAGGVGASELMRYRNCPGPTKRIFFPVCPSPRVCGKRRETTRKPPSWPAAFCWIEARMKWPIWSERPPEAVRGQVRGRESPKPMSCCAGI